MGSGPLHLSSVRNGALAESHIRRSLVRKCLAFESCLITAALELQNTYARLQEQCNVMCSLLLVITKQHQQHQTHTRPGASTCCMCTHMAAWLCRSALMYNVKNVCAGHCRPPHLISCMQQMQLRHFWAQPWRSFSKEVDTACACNTAAFIALPYPDHIDPFAMDNLRAHHLGSELS